MSLSEHNSTIYFDNASTSHPKPENLSRHLLNYIHQIGASPGRGTYGSAQKAYDLVEDVRQKLAMLLNVQKSSHIIFTHNATHSANIVLKGLLKEGDHAIISNFEHNAVYRPLHRLKSENRILYDVWESDLTGDFDLKKLESLIRPETKLIAINHASNVLGVLSPVKKIAEAIQGRKIALLVDVAQTAGLIHTDFGNIADYIIGTGHKSLLGPSGLGFMYVKDGDTLSTLYEGGSGNMSSSPYQPETLPHKFEAGTCNYLGIAGLKGSLEYLEHFGMEKMRKQLLEYTQKAIGIMKSINGITVYGPENVENKVPLISFNIDGMFPNEVAHALQEKLICVRSGIHCAPLMHKTLKTLPHGTVRLSFGHLNTESELERLKECLLELKIRS